MDELKAAMAESDDEAVEPGSGRSSPDNEAAFAELLAAESPPSGEAGPSDGDDGADEGAFAEMMQQSLSDPETPQPSAPRGESSAPVGESEARDDEISALEALAAEAEAKVAAALETSAEAEAAATVIQGKVRQKSVR